MPALGEVGVEHRLDAPRAVELLERLRDLDERAAVSPYGSGALAGSSLNRAMETIPLSCEVLLNSGFSGRT